MIKKNWLDKAIEAVAPTWGLKRAYSRFLIQEQRRKSSLSAYKGASKDRIRGRWNPGTYWQTVDDELLEDLETLRERSRDLARNSALGSGILDTLVLNTVGSGFRVSPNPRADVLGISDDLVDEFRAAAKNVWEEWSSSCADITGRTNFNGLLRLIERSAMESGDVFVHWLMKNDPDKPYMLTMELIEADRVSEKDQLNKYDRGGVVIDKYGTPQGFWVWGQSKSSAWIPHRENGRLICEQHFYRLRPGQNRGVPIFAPVLTLFDDLENYIESEVVAARVAAAIALVVKSTDPLAAANRRAGRTQSDGTRLETFEPGEVHYLNPEEDIEMINPQRPGSSFQMFIEKITRLICRGIGLPYELGALDFSKTNYSSAKASLLESRRQFRVRQKALAVKVCKPAYEMVIEEAYLTGKLPMISREAWKKFKSEWTRAEWLFPGWGWVDPAKEVAASVAAVEAGFSSLATEIMNWTGQDYRDVQEQIAREEKEIKEIRSRVLGEEQPAEQKQPEEEGQGQEQEQEQETNDQEEEQSAD